MKAINIINQVDKCSNYRLVHLQDVKDQVSSKLISCNGWPDCDQERNAFKPHYRDVLLYWALRGVAE